MSATSRNITNTDQGSSTPSKVVRSQPFREWISVRSGEGGGGSDVTGSGDSLINSCSGASFSGSTSRKDTSISSDVKRTINPAKAPSTSSNDSTSTSSIGVSGAHYSSASIDTTLISSSVSKLTNTSSVAKTTQIANPGNDDNGFESTSTVSKPDRGSANYTTNGSNSEARQSNDEHRTSTAENLSKTNLYIRGLSTDTTDELLFNLCSRFGSIFSTKAILDKVTGLCKGYGFVQFSNPRSAEIAVQELNRSGIQAQMARISPKYSSHNQHQPHHNPHNHFHNNHFHSNQNNGSSHHYYHHPNGGSNHNSGLNNARNHNHVHSQNNNSIHHMNSDPDPTNLYIANLPTNMSEQELELLLSNYGPVVSTRILRDLDNRSKGVGFARMESRVKCQEIIENLNGKSCKGSSEALLVKFADGGARKRHQHNNHHHNNHHLHHQQQHLKVPHQDENRWRDDGNVPGDDSNISNFDQQSNIPHDNQMSDLAMMGALGYPRLQQAFLPTMAPSSAYPQPLGPSTGSPQWIHPGGPGHLWNLIPQQMIPTSGLAPSNQAAAAAAFPFGHISQLTSQMQGLQISHHPSAQIPDGYLPPQHQWAATMWSHPLPPHQSNQSHSMRLATPIQHPPSTKPNQDQLTSTTEITTESSIAASISQQEHLNDSKQSCEK